MAKRKSGVNDIIYELDNDDLDSSDDERKESKLQRLSDDNTLETVTIPTSPGLVLTEGVNPVSASDVVCETASTAGECNGGKTPDLSGSENESVIAITEKLVDEVDSGSFNKTILPESSVHNNNLTDVITVTNNNDDQVDTSSNANIITVLNDVVSVDSPSSGSDPGVVGCENRTPLVTVRFRDNKLAKSYKHKLKEFMLNLIKLHDKSYIDGSETETDLELDVWPEDLEEDLEKVDVEDSLFFVDTDPGVETVNEIPRYRQASTVISNVEDKEPSPPQVTRRGPICFNCDGPHPLRDCTKPRNNARIAENRRNMPSPKLGRYHVEDDQKYGHLSPGRISGQLRHALGLQRHELPLYIYRMRLLGYPPGWLETARISHSGITMFDSSGQAVMDPEDEEGELCEPGSKDKYDIKKILDFPGFNVPASSRYLEEGHLFGFPPMVEQDSKIAMLQALAPNAMKAYKRKKLTFFPSAGNDTSGMEGQAEMDLDSGDETAAFPSVPPLPDEAPPPAPPPPPPGSPPPPPPPPRTSPPPPPVSDLAVQKDRESESDVEIIEVMKVGDIPVPITDLIVLDETFDDLESSGRNSPSLDDLEAKKRRLLDALKSDTPIVISDDNADSDIQKDEEIPSGSEEPIAKVIERIETEKGEEINKVQTESDSNDNKNEDEIVIPTSPVKLDPGPKLKEKLDTVSDSDSETRTPKSTTGHVKSTLYGTPVLNIASPYEKLPSDVKFAKDICDVINFENLPNSTGKYKKISNLLKKVKSEVDRIQES